MLILIIALIIITFLIFCLYSNDKFCKQTSAKKVKEANRKTIVNRKPPVLSVSKTTLKTSTRNKNNYSNDSYSNNYYFGSSSSSSCAGSSSDSSSSSSSSSCD